MKRKRGATMKRRIISALLLVVMLISLVPAQAFAEETTADEPETLPEAQQIPAEETIPDEEVEIIPMPDAEYEEIIEEPEEDPAEEPEPTDEPEEEKEPEEDEDEEPEEAAEKVSVRFDLTPAELTLRVYPADAAECPETQINIPDETDITATQDELAEEYTAAEPQPIAPEADGTYLLLPGEYCYDAECEGYIPLENVAFTVSESAEIAVVLEADSESTASGTTTAIASGSCGENLTWTLNKSGTLTISGTGAMEDYNHTTFLHTTSPWEKYDNKIKTVVIKSGVTSIGDYAFYWCDALTSVTIPDSVTSIGDYVFGFCYALTKVTIPNSVTSIGDLVFFNCTSLTSVTIGSSVRSIGEDAFYGCKALTSVAIPDSVTSIGDGAFANCTVLKSVTIGSGLRSIRENAFYGCKALTSIEAASDNKNYSSIDGVLFNKTETELICFPCGRGDKYIIPDGVTSIGDSAFYYCSALKSVTIGNSVTSIGYSAFSGCKSLTSVTIGNSVTSIGSSAFSGCKSLTSVSIPDSVTDIVWYTFQKCYGLAYVTIGSGVRYIGQGAFDVCDGITDVYYRGTKAQWEAIRIEKYNDFLLSAELHCRAAVIASGSCGESLTWTLDENGLLTVSGTGAMADYACNGRSTAPWSGYWEEIITVVIESGVTSIGNHAFSNCTALTSVIIPGSVTSIGDYTFNGCTVLKSVTIGSGVTSIGKDAFSYCTTLTSVTIPDSVTSIGKDAFSYCTSLTSVAIPDSVTSIGDGAFNTCTTLTSVTIPNSVTSIGDWAFWYCTALTSVTIPDSVDSIGDFTFCDCRALTSINVDPGNRCYSSVNGVVFNKDTTELVCFPAGRTGAYTIPNSVTNVGDYAFYYCTALTSVTIPNSVTSIGIGAFSGCSALTSVTIPDSVTSIGDGAFSGCTSLTSVLITNNVREIGASAFLSCDVKNVYYFGAETQWEEISVGSGNESMVNAEIHFINASDNPCGENLTWTLDHAGTLRISGTGAMADYSDVDPAPWAEYSEIIKSVVIEPDVASIGNYAFCGCKALINAAIPKSVTNIGDNAFAGCADFTDVYYGAAMTQWLAVGIGSGNECLTQANVNCISDLKLSLDREYMAMQIGESAVLSAAVTPAEWAEYLTWSAENPDGKEIISVSGSGSVTALGVGTAYAVATVSYKDYTFTARCRVDVTEKSVGEEIEISGIELGTTAVTSELYSRDYAEADILLLLPQNMSVMSADAAEKPEDNGIAIKSARFMDPAAAEKFDLAVVDDRRVAVVPKDGSIENAKAVKSSYTSAVAVTVGNTEFVTDAKLKLTVKKTLPKLKADAVQFNSFYSGQSAPIVINGASVTAIRPDTGKKLAVPAWLTLSDDGKLSIAPDAPGKSASGSAYVLVDTEEWAVPAAVTVSVKNTYKAPKLKLSAASVTMSSVSSRGVEMKLMPTAKNETLEQYNVTGLTAYDGYTVENFDAETGAFTLKATEGSAAGKITLYVSFADTETTVPIALTVKKTLPVIKLKTSSVTLNPAYGDMAIIDVTITPADYDDRTVSVSNAESELEVWYKDGKLYVHSLPITKYSSTYKVTVSISGGKETVLTVRTAKGNLKPSVTLRASGAIDLTYSDSAVTITPAFRNFNGGYAVSGGTVTETKGKTEISSGDISSYFSMEQNGNTLTLKKAEGTELTAGNTYTAKLTMLLGGEELTAAANITVKATPVNLRLSKSALTLNKLANDSAAIGVTCTTKNYTLGEPVISVMDKSGKQSAEGKLDVSYSGGMLYVAVNDATEYGAVYKVLISAGEGYKAAVLNVTVPAQAKSAITGTLKAKGSIDIIRSGSGITLVPTYKNVSSAEYTERVEVYSSADKFAKPVEGVFAIDGMKLANICADSRLKYKVRVIAGFANGTEAATPLTAITVKTGAARLTVSGTPVLYLKDVNSRGDFRITSADLTLNGIARAEIKDAKNAAMFELYEYGGGRFAIGFKDGVIAPAAAKLKSVSIPINIWLDGSETAKPNAAVTIKINIAK